MKQKVVMSGKLKVVLSVLMLVLAASIVVGNVNDVNSEKNKTELSIKENIGNVAVDSIKSVNSSMKYGDRLSSEIVDRMNTANVPLNVINATSGDAIFSKGATYPGYAYTNPVSGISIFSAEFSSVNIYTTDTVEWGSYAIYLPQSSYVDISVVGNIFGYQNYAYPDIKVDDIYTQRIWAVKYNVCSGDVMYCGDNWQVSSMRYLQKGWHNIAVTGWSQPAYPDDIGGYSYWTWGLIKAVAYPEYSAITVAYPNGYETWYRGQTKTITWKSVGNPGANVKIELYKAGVLKAVISSKTLNDGSYSWYVPTYQPTGTDYKIKITSYENPVYYDWSNNYFKIY